MSEFTVNDNRVSTTGVTEEPPQTVEAPQEVPPVQEEQKEPTRDDILNSVDQGRQKRRELIQVTQQTLAGMQRNTLPGRKELIQLSNLVFNLCGMQEAVLDGLLVNLIATNNRLRMTEASLVTTQLTLDSLKTMLVSKNTMTQEELDLHLQETLDDFKAELEKQALPQEPTEKPTE